jgi:hypothetical protein
MGGRDLVFSAVKTMHAQLKNVEIQRAGSDEHGEIVSGGVSLQGYVAPVEAYFDGRYPHCPYLRIGEEERISLTTPSQGTSGDELDEELICPVLLCLDESTSRFSRLGYLSRYWPKKEEWFKSAKENYHCLITSRHTSPDSHLKCQALLPPVYRIYEQDF